MENQGLQLSKSEIVHNEQNSANLLSREWQALAGGFGDGLARTGSTTVANLKEAGNDFANSPLKATANYLANHWQDAAAGAAITFLRPTKWANAALVAYSLRGTGYATYDAFVGALDPKANISRLRKDYAEEISQQGTAFLASMPMAMLGGNIGRAGANAVFGRNLGALDMLTGRVSISDVKTNLWNVYDKVNPPKVKLVITDMDNTLASHSKYFSQGVEKAIGEVSAKTKIPQAELNKVIGEQMELYRSHDYPWSVELALKDRLNVGKPGGMSIAEFEGNIVKPFWNTIDASLKENYKAFPGVKETLLELQNRKIPVAILSDAPTFIGLRRLANMELPKGTIDRFYGLHNWPEPKGLPKEMLKHGHDRVETGLKTNNGLKESRALPAQWEKPETHGFESLMSKYKVRPSETLMIGDSRVKDVGVAHASGSRGIWAKYGAPNAAEEAVLTRLRPLPENSGGVGKASGVPKQYAPYLEAAESFDRLLAHLEPKRAPISELAAQAGRSLMLRPEFNPAVGAYAYSQPGLLADMTYERSPGRGIIPPFVRNQAELNKGR